jgi:hypothetical protein
LRDARGRRSGNNLKHYVSDKWAIINPYSRLRELLDFANSDMSLMPDMIVFTTISFSTEQEKLIALVPQNYDQQEMALSALAIFAKRNGSNRP